MIVEQPPLRVTSNQRRGAAATTGNQPSPMQNVAVKAG